MLSVRKGGGGGKICQLTNQLILSVRMRIKDQSRLDNTKREEKTIEEKKRK